LIFGKIREIQQGNDWRFAMTVARSEIVDVEMTRYYHVISKTVRGAWLLKEGREDRKQWIEDRLELLAGNFAVSVAGFAILDNHLHLLVRLEPDMGKELSDEEVIRRWVNVYPPRTLDLEDEKLFKAWIDYHLKDTKLIEKYRERLQNLGWFMKALKEPLSRTANREDDCQGAFWQGRYKSIAILDDEALLATCAYIDLNPVAAGIAATPETSPHTSFRQRMENAKEKDAIEDLKAAREGTVQGSRAAKNIEADHWLAPIEDRRNAKSFSSEREGLLETYSLGSYALLVDYTARLFRNGKARLNAAAAEIFDRMGTSVEFWSDRIKKMLSSKDLRGSYFAGNSESLQPLKEKLKHRIANLSPQPT